MNDANDGNRLAEFVVDDNVIGGCAPCDQPFKRTGGGESSTRVLLLAIVVLLVIALAYYFFVYRKKHPGGSTGASKPSLFKRYL